MAGVEKAELSEGIMDVFRYVLIRIPAQFSSVNYSLI